MKASEIRNMTEDEMRRTLTSLRDEYFKLRLRRGSEELPNPLRLRTIRRDIARLLTVLTELERKKGVGGEKSKNAKT
jgi:large subunit ribosomal protein L29